MHADILKAAHVGKRGPSSIINILMGSSAAVADGGPIREHQNFDH
jgi:hypothetical protein